ncbi:MAG: hypothetical protein A3F74_04575 [Betaproteobacteria bacterium RIFCSPLOWO2_12_FULL_62_58]|nr:MAG: hypothetical protein A3F74_04575 [Betaproteobacteria bacterium RIFCSPLOWO2_12_FULL_62_58]
MVCYNFLMKQKPLIETNPHLRAPEQYRKALITSVASSTAIETGETVEAIASTLATETMAPPIKVTQNSSR